MAEQDILDAIAALSAKIDATDSEIAIIKNIVNQNSNDIYTLTTNLAITDGKVDTLITNLSTVDGKADTLITNLAITDGKADTIISKVNSISSTEEEFVLDEYGNITYDENNEPITTENPISIFDNFFEVETVPVLDENGDPVINPYTLEPVTENNTKNRLFEMYEFTKKMYLDFDVMEGKIDTIDGKADTIDGKVDTIDGKVDTLITNLSTVDGKADTLITNLAITDGKINNIESKLIAVDGKVDTITADISNLSTSLGDINIDADDLNGLTASNSDLSFKIGELKSSTDNLRTSVNNLINEI